MVDLVITFRGTSRTELTRASAPPGLAPPRLRQIDPLDLDLPGNLALPLQQITLPGFAQPCPWSLADLPVESFQLKKIEHMNGGDGEFEQLQKLASGLFSIGPS